MSEGPSDRVQALFEAALKLPPDARAQWLVEQCADAPELREDVESLLAAHDAAGGFLRTEDARPALAALVAADRSDEVVAGFRLLRPIGSGGMGAVYLAERTDGAFAQQVAVKLLDLPARDDRGLRRFQAERQILASLHHPHIVTLVDGGVAEDGQPFLVMELVEGVPISRHCAEQGLSLDRRLALFRQVCGAVQHAHQHQVIHRDLKPANILVTADGVPKVLDFGVAKLVASAAVEAQATVGPQPLTANYASPEQLRGLPATTASDIYALGVLLYELVAGVRPYDHTGRPLDEMLRLVMQGDFPRVGLAARQHAAELPYHPRRVDGDLEAIVGKAMAADPATRYASAAELSQDLERYLHGHGVIARKPSAWYLVSRLALRNRVAASAVVVALAAVVGGAGVAYWQMRVAIEQRENADQRFNDLRSLANSLIFTIHDQVERLQGSTAVRQLIVQEALTYLERLQQHASDDPNLQLELARGYYQIARVQGLPSARNLGDRDGALENFRRTVILLEPLADRNGGSAQLKIMLGYVQLALAETARSASDQDQSVQALVAAERLASDVLAGAPTEAAAQQLLANTRFYRALWAEKSEAVAAWTAALGTYQTLLDASPDDPERQRNVALASKYLGGALEAGEEFEAALAHHQRAYDLDRSRLEAAPDNVVALLDVAIDLSNLAFGYRQMNRLEEAAEALEQSTAIRLGLASADPEDVQARSRLAFALSRLGEVYSLMGRHGDAIFTGREAVEKSRTLQALGTSERINLGEYLVTLGMSLRNADRDAEACAPFAEADRILSSEPERVQRPALAERLSVLLESCGSGPP